MCTIKPKTSSQKIHNLPASNCSSQSVPSGVCLLTSQPDRYRFPIIFKSSVSASQSISLELRSLRSRCESLLTRSINTKINSSYSLATPIQLFEKLKMTKAEDKAEQNLWRMLNRGIFRFGNVLLVHTKSSASIKLNFGVFRLFSGLRVVEAWRQIWRARRGKRKRNDTRSLITH